MFKRLLNCMTHEEDIEQLLVTNNVIANILTKKLNRIKSHKKTKK